jgi:inner membrane organizing system protein 1
MISIVRISVLTSKYQWDRCLSSLLIRSSLGLSFGVVFSVLLFKRRAWPAVIGLGFGAGRAYEECNSSFLRTNREIVKNS